MNKFSHDSITQDFTIFSVGLNRKPKPSLYRTPENFIMTAGDYFSYTFPVDLISFDKSIVDPIYEVVQSQLPDS
jgi:hypothetical protein